MRIIKKRAKIIALVCFIFFGITIIFNPERPMILRIGFYCDSSWDVPYAFSYQVVDDAIAIFQKMHPNVKVIYESGIRKNDYRDYLSNLILRGEQPDVFMIPENEFNLLSSTKALEPLDQYFRKDRLSKESFFTCSLDAGKHFDEQMALPFESNPTLMCMNKDLLAAHQIDVPDSSWTSADFFDICEKITSTKKRIYGEVGYTWRNAIEAYGLDLFNAQGTVAYFNTPDMRKALSYQSRLSNLQGSHKVESQDFDEGRVAFMPMTLAEYRSYRPYPYRIAKYSTFNWKCIGLPAQGLSSSKISVETSLFAMSSQSKHKQLAWELLQVLCMNEEIQQELMNVSAGVSVLKNVVLSEETQQIMSESDITEDALSPELLITIMEHSVTLPQFKEYHQLMEIADYRIMQSLNQGTMDLDLADIQKAIESYLKESRD